jgi:uncharacterized protein
MAARAETTPSPLDPTVERVVATPAALAAIREVREERGPIVFFLSHGCCDGSTPMCFPLGELLVGDRDVLVGAVGDVPVYVDVRGAELWKTGQVILDVADGEPESFSLPAGPGRHFTARTRLCVPTAP